LNRKVILHLFALLLYNLLVMNPLYIISFLLFLMALIYLTFFERKQVRWIIKILTSLHFLGLAVYSLLNQSGSMINIILSIGLFFAFWGDVVLCFKKKARIWFLLGVMSFLITQIFYIIYFTLQSFLWITFLIPVPILIVVIYYVLQSKRFRISKKDFFLIVYIYSMSCTLVSSLVVQCLTINPFQVILTMGILFFFLSDIFLFHVYYANRKDRIIIVAYILLYYLGQGLIAYYIGLPLS